MKVTHLPTDPGPAAWNAILPPQESARALDGKHEADWLVIGAGFAGLAAARRLRQLAPTDSICVLDARRVAEGPAGRNSGFMIDLPHNLVSEDYAGALEADRQQTAMNRAAISFAENACSEYGLGEDVLRRSGKINAAATAKGARHNRDYAAHLEKLGEAHELLDAQRMQEICGSDYYRNGLYTPGTAMLQPAAFVRGMAQGLFGEGVDLFENTPVTALRRENGAWIADMPDGTVSAPKVILTVNGNVESFGHFRRRLMHIYLYASMTRPLTPEEDAWLGGEAVWGFTPADPMGTTLRKIATPEGPRIVVRNGVVWSPQRKSDAAAVKRVGRAHDRSFVARFPLLRNVSMDYRWGGLLCLSRNGVSAFGEIEPGLYSACCQNGLGAARGTLSGMLVAELATGQSSPMLDCFAAQDAPRRLPPEPFASIGAKTVLRWNEFRARREL